ncbi:hypothetical protein C1893_21630 [Pseudomonas sp. MPR-ANC1]|uniref:glycosyltransferase n=1 Tax=Pseudomonas sp. MPR-ANC1 TaxID=2075548 RepID=UPI000CD15459|nr:glycosyltransferase [Pseudomonas sp. MPR-ANC1]POA46187.1 hypothetical protein C1893_21630 [Pseudomonas sp. MPR-ANC1]
MSKFNFENELIATQEHELPAIGLHFTTPERNFSSEGEARSVNVIYEDAQNNDVVWQPDVLWEARNIADRQGITHVIDIGCGGGHKLVHYFQGGGYDVMGIDYHGSLSLSRAAYPEWQWVECDLTSWDDLSRISLELTNTAPVVMILSDVIEHLTDPRPLVAWMRAQLIARPGSRLVVSTPDRTLLDYEDVNSRPENKSHVREWSFTELERYFVSSGLEIIRSGHTRANQYDPVISTIFIECACSEEFYKEFLIDVGLLHGDEWPQHLLVTTEYAGIHNTGGIGTFVREQRESYGYDKSLCLFGGVANGLTQEILRAEKLVSTSMLLVESDIQSLPLEDQFLKAVQQFLFYFPDISTIQYGDYQGIGCRIAQAKQTGLLPQTIRIIAHCHGITHYLENAHESWLGLSHSGTAEKEKISVEGADLAVFPTTFLRELYAEAGINVPAENNVLLRYPLHSPVSELDASTKIDTLIFYGKRSRMKGYDLLLDSLAGVDVEQWKKAGITTICLIGPKVHGNPQTDSMLEVLREHYQVEEFCNLSRQQAIDALHERAHRAICLMPYLGDNHPYALLDVAFSTTIPLMANAGGVPEMIPEEFRSICLADPNALSFRARIHGLLSLSSAAFHDLRESLVSTMAQTQNDINELVKAFPGDQQPKLLAGNTGEATIIVPVFNTPLDYIEDLIFGINNQSLKPAEVVFVDDASEEDYVDGLQSLVKEHLLLPYRIIRHPQNKGLAGARNTGLAAAQTDFIINIDSDDVPLNDFVRDIVFSLRSNPQHAAAVPYLCAFDDGTDFNIVRSGMYVYRPLGDGVIASQLDNQLGHANAGFRTSTLREFGGWDESSKAMWEDWALYLKLTAAGRKIAIIPKIGCLYRVRPQSMLRTYKTWPAMRRLANNMLGLPRYENFRLQAMLRSYRDVTAQEAESRHRLAALQVEFSILQQEINSSRQELNRGGVRAVRSLANRLAQYPALFDAVRKCGRTGWKILRKLAHLGRRLRG